MKILISGFDAFGGEKINPSIEVVKLLPEEIKGAKIIKLEIPTIRYKSVEKLKEVIEKEKPDVVLNIGQAGGRADITVERIGINIDDFSIEDNGGNKPIDEAILNNAPDAYFVKLPIKSMVKKMKDNNIPASISNSAGTFVCNHVIYNMAHLSNTEYTKMKTGFIHIPFLPEQVINKNNVASMPIDMMLKGIILSVEAIIENSCKN